MLSSRLNRVAVICLCRRRYRRDAVPVAEQCWALHLVLHRSICDLGKRCKPLRCDLVQLTRHKQTSELCWASGTAFLTFNSLPSLWICKGDLA